MVTHQSPEVAGTARTAYQQHGRLDAVLEPTSFSPRFEPRISFSMHIGPKSKFLAFN